MLFFSYNFFILSFFFFNYVYFFFLMTQSECETSLSRKEEKKIINRPPIRTTLVDFIQKVFN